MSKTMTLSEALRRIATIKGQISEARERASANVTHRADAAVAFDFGVCVERGHILVEELITLKTAIAKANIETMLEWEGRTVSQAAAIRIRDEFKSEMAWLDTLTVGPAESYTIEELGYEDGKHVRMKAAWVCRLPAAKRAERRDDLKSKFDQINNLIERNNGRTTVTV